MEGLRRGACLLVGLAALLLSRSLPAANRWRASIAPMTTAVCRNHPRARDYDSARE